MVKKKQAWRTVNYLYKNFLYLELLPKVEDYDINVESKNSLPNQDKITKTTFCLKTSGPQTLGLHEIRF